jgi:hypothetical protein
MTQSDRSNGQSNLLRTIVGANFRANPEFRLVLYDRLPMDQQELLQDLTKDPEFYGVLMPSGDSARRTKSACQNTALLLYSLVEPGPLPAYVQTSLGDEANQAVAEMVLDGVLEIEHEGSFISGTAAYDLIYNSPEPGRINVPMGQLTRRALIYAQMLELSDSSMLSARLYSYNRVPLSTRWRNLFPNSAAVASYLGIDGKGELRALLGRSWNRVRSTAESEGWFQWSSTTNRSFTEPHTRYKLYVSPTPDATSRAFKAVVESLMNSSAYHFKVGDDAYGILRPDKIVLYFREFEALQETASAIAARLEDCPAQGVPFTAAIGEDGLLSWGVDPPPQNGVMPWQERESWRLWVVTRIAAAMVVAQQTPDARLEPWQFALERLRLDKVDTDTWNALPGFGHSVVLEER